MAVKMLTASTLLVISTVAVTQGLQRTIETLSLVMVRAIIFSTLTIKKSSTVTFNTGISLILFMH